ncbi:MAG: IS110 family transposase [Chloroflexota bacterium]|nr:IS110 family transposase [Chloroflexota bacterium]
MKHYVGLDVSQEETHICVIDEDDRKIWQGKCLPTPEAIGKLIKEHAPDAAKIGLETGNLSTYLWHGLNDMGLPVICIDAYHAHGVLKLRMNKTDKNDAHGLAQIMRSGWFKAVKVKSFASHEIRALYRARSSLVSMRSDVVNQIRGCLRVFGIFIKGIAGVGFEKRVQEIIDEGGTLAAPLQAQLTVLQTIKKEIEELDELVLDHSWACPSCRALMTIPGVGPMTAAHFVLAVDDVERFNKSKSVAAYFGLTPKRYQSGDMDFNGRISKRGNRIVRHHLYEAANILMTRVKKPSALQEWGLRIAKRSGMKKARVAVARKLSVIMHQMLLTGECFVPYPEPNYGVPVHA